MTESTIDTGTAYGRKKPSYDARLTEVGAGTPMGEAMRRYWHPIASSSGLTSELPHRARVLGEDLIVFRDGEGRAGVVAERCAHRGTSLFYGRVEDDGIRCCYHGWKFDVEGNCLDQPCEPGGGARREVARQPWYPTEERYGLVFVYMGPPDRKPALPRWDALDPADEGDQYWASWPIPGCEATGMKVDFNYLQVFENAIDGAHTTWLHTHHSGVQLAGTGAPDGLPESFYEPGAVPEAITYLQTDFGASYHQQFEGTDADGKPVPMEWRLESQLPNIIALPDFTIVEPDPPRHNLLIWTVPMDDTHHTVFFSIRSPDPGRMGRLISGISQNGKAIWELTPEESQKFPSDMEAQGSQGDITFHSEETLATTDRGVVMIRRMLKKMVDDVEAGNDPIGFSRDPDELRPVASGVFTVSENGSGEKGTAATTSPVTVGGE